MQRKKVHLKVPALSPRNTTLIHCIPCMPITLIEVEFILLKSFLLILVATCGVHVGRSEVCSSVKVSRRTRCATKSSFLINCQPLKYFFNYATINYLQKATWEKRMDIFCPCGNCHYAHKNYHSSNIWYMAKIDRCGMCIKTTQWAKQWITMMHFWVGDCLHEDKMATSYSLWVWKLLAFTQFSLNLGHWYNSIGHKARGWDQG